jgi:hypothetical protein
MTGRKDGGIKYLKKESMDTDRDLQPATTGTPTHDMADSLTGNLCWLVPPAAALCYPLTVKALYESGKLLHRVGGPGDAAAWLAIVVSVALVYSVPAVGIGAAYLLGRDERTSSSELLARRLAHLAVAAPPLFVLIGVVFYLLHAPNGDSVFWWILWLAALAAAAWAMRRQGTDGPASSTPNPVPLRVARGTSALLIVLIFLAWRLLNHASAVYSHEFNRAMLNALRKWYRSELVQPLLVTLMLFQVVSGMILFWRATATRSDLYRTLQTSTGAFLSAFIVSHLNAVFISGAVSKVDTNFLWASGAPVGLLPDAWNVRLIPHYSLGVWFVITHMGLGLRGVLLAHKVSPTTADRVAWGVGALGAVVALTITVAQLGVHDAS